LFFSVAGNVTKIYSITGWLFSVIFTPPPVVDKVRLYINPPPFRGAEVLRDGMI